jgi:hypothetical protein
MVLIRFVPLRFCLLTKPQNPSSSRQATTDMASSRALTPRCFLSSPDSLHGFKEKLGPEFEP